MVVGQRALQGQLAAHECLGGELERPTIEAELEDRATDLGSRERQLDGLRRAGGVDDEVEALVLAGLLERHRAKPDRERRAFRVDVAHDDLGAVAL